MRILLDACIPIIPIDFRNDLAAAGTVETAQYAGLSRLSNGALLTAMSGRYDVLVTVDSSLRYQQTIAGRPLSVLLLRAPTNAVEDLQPLVPLIMTALASIKPGEVVEV